LEALSVGAVAIAIVGFVRLRWGNCDTAAHLVESGLSARLPEAGEAMPAGTCGRLGTGARDQSGHAVDCAITADPPTLEWRFSRFMSCGVDAATALELAADRETDMHELARLIARGCAPDLAARIVAPLTAARERSTDACPRRRTPGSRYPASRSPVVPRRGERTSG
jgi:hypothetical protein